MAFLLLWLRFQKRQSTNQWCRAYHYAIDFWFWAYPDCTWLFFANSAIQHGTWKQDQFRSYALISSIFEGSWAFSLFSLWQVFRVANCIFAQSDIHVYEGAEFEITCRYIFRHSKMVCFWFELMMKSWPPAGRNYTEELRFYLKIQKFVFVHLFPKFTDSRKVNAISTESHLPGWERWTPCI